MAQIFSRIPYDLQESIGKYTCTAWTLGISYESVKNTLNQV